jgi:hypothetical protein
VLLAAASSAETTPPATGTYWHIRRIHAITVQGRPPVGNVEETWAAKNGWWYGGFVPLAGGRGSLEKEKHATAFELVDHMLPLDRLERLPADPQRLTTWARSYARGIEPHMRKQDEEFMVTETLSGLLYAVPVSPKVRAAAFRALAQRPGVTSDGRVKDARGRIGDGVTIDGGFHLIIDPTTAFVLQESSGSVDGTKKSSTVYLEVGWTNGRPHVPTPS